MVITLDLLRIRGNDETTRGQHHMDYMVIRTKHHGTVEVTTAAYDAAMDKYLPASPMKLRNLCEERTSIDYRDITEVSVFVALLADWDYNVDGSPLSMDAMFRDDYASELPITIQVWECQESGELIEGDARVCAQVMARDAEDNPLTWRLVNEWTPEADDYYKQQDKETA